MVEVREDLGMPFSMVINHEDFSVRPQRRHLSLNTWELGGSFTALVGHVVCMTRVLCVMSVLSMCDVHRWVSL